MSGKTLFRAALGLATTTGDGLYTLPLPTPVNNVFKARLYVQVADNQGNITRVVRTRTSHSLSGAGRVRPTPRQATVTATDWMGGRKSAISSQLSPSLRL